MKVSLIHPPQYNVIDDRLDPPLGLMTIAANLVGNGIDDVSITDLSGKKEEEWDILCADVYGITVYSPSVDIVKNIARKCKALNKNCVVVCGGIHATILPQTLLEDHNIDTVVIGYGENAMLDIIRDFPKVAKTYYGSLNDISRLPIPARNLILLDTYSRTVQGHKAFNIQTTRGCPFSCSFCSEHVLTKKILYRDVESVKRELDDIVGNYKGNALFIYDDIFTLNKKRLKNLLSLFRDNGVIFDFHLRSDSVVYDECKDIKASGGHMVRIGTESFSDSVLSKMNKGIKRAQNIEAIKIVKDSGLLSRIFLIFGFPGETEETVDETISGIEEADPDQIFLSTFVPFPGCSVWNSPEKYGIIRIDKDYSKYSFVSDVGKGNIVFDTVHSDRDTLSILQEKLYRYVYSRVFRGDSQTYYPNLLRNIKK